MRRFVAVFLLLGGLVVAGGANAVTTYVDATNSLTYPPSGSISSSASSPWRLTMSITTGSDDVSVSSLYIKANSASAFTGDVLVNVYPANQNGQPVTSSIYFTQTLSVLIPSASSSAYTALNITGLTLHGNSSYVISVSTPNSSVTDLGYTATYTSPNTLGGFVYNQSGYLTSVGSYFALPSSAAALFELSGSTVASVPTLSEWAQILLALMVIGVAWHFHNNRQYS